MKRTVLVTGGAGFIGSCFIRRLLQDKSTQIVNLDKLTYAATLGSVPNPPAGRYQLVEGDIGDRQLIEEVLQRYQPDWVVNFAAESHVDRSIENPESFVMTNVLGTFRLLEGTYSWWQRRAASAQQAFRFLHVSTDEVYGSLETKFGFREESPYAPNSPYSASKAAADHFVRAYFHTYGLPVLTVNSSNNYGPFQFPEKLIPLMILKALHGESLPLYGDGSQVRDWLFVDDHCSAIELVLEKGQVGEVYNVGGDGGRTNLQVVETICDVLDDQGPSLSSGSRRKLITFVTDRPGHDQRYVVDSSKLRRQTGWAPQQSFLLGLQQTVAWYSKHVEWVKEACGTQYNGQRLGLKPWDR